AIDGVITQTGADCAAILRSDSTGALTVLAQRGFRRILDPRPDHGIVGRAIRTADVVQGGQGLGGADTLLEHEGLLAAVAIPLMDERGLAIGALFVGRRRPVPFESDALGTLLVVAQRLVEALGPAS